MHVQKILVGFEIQNFKWTLFTQYDEFRMTFSYIGYIYDLKMYYGNIQECLVETVLWFLNFDLFQKKSITSVVWYLLVILVIIMEPLLEGKYWYFILSKLFNRFVLDDPPQNFRLVEVL